MGRQSRQTRRAQQRRQQSSAHPLHRSGKAGIMGMSPAVLGGTAVIVAAIVLFLIFGVFKGGGSANGASPTAVPTIPAGPSALKIGCDQGMSGYHIHAHIYIVNKGKIIQIPTDFGHDYNHDCLFWMHAHQDLNGIIHLEAPAVVHPTLAQYQAVARRTLPAQDVVSLTPPAGETLKAWVDQKPYSGNPANIRLYRHTNVVIEYGPPFIPPPPFNWNRVPSL